MTYEEKAKRNKAWGEIGYGVMWFFVAGLIAIMIDAKSFSGTIHTVAVALSVVAGLYKIVRGILSFKD